MTGLAGIAGWQMGGRFATGLHRIMTVNTTGKDVGMVNARAQPTRYHVAAIARFDGGNMIDTLTLRDRIVMTAGAGADHLTVIDATGRHRFP